MSVLRSAGLLGREGLRLVRDRSSGSRFPHRAADVDAGTMGALLGVPVRSVRALEGTSGTTDRSRLALLGAGAPGSVFVKTSAADAGTRVFGGLARLGEVEVGFYRDLRPTLDIEAPEAFAARFDPGTGRFLIVLEDLVARGASFVDTRTPLSVDQAAAALSTLARLHAAEHLPAGQLRWLTSNSRDALLPLVAAALPRLGRRVRDSDATLAAVEGDRLLGSYRRWAPLLDLGPQSVLHGDPHPGNLYLLGDRVGLLDWQAVRRGSGLRDASYLMVLSLAIDDRRRAEGDLIEHYRSELESAGGPQLSAGAAWLMHRRMAAYAYVAASFTVGLGGLQGEAIADTGLRRAVAAVDDLEPAAVLGI